jgi:hypothetical protein
MKLVLVSSAVLWDKARGAIYPDVASSLEKLSQQKDAIFFVSSHKEPPWLKANFPFVRFQPCDYKTKQSGEIVQRLLDANKGKLKHSDVVVLGGTNADFFMAVQSQTLLVRCEWTPLEDRIRHYGIPLREAKAIPQLVEVLRDKEPWYFKYTSKFLDVFSLTNSGTIGETDAGILQLIDRLKGCLKEGAVRNRDEFTAHLLSSLYVTDAFREVDWWGWYPSSQIITGPEVMESFCTLARTTFHRNSKGPLFTRHKSTIRRSHHRKEIDNDDPTSEITTLHLNPAYEGHLEGKTIAVLDDYLTYGLSFGVASALFKKAGVSKVLGVAMGKFGNRGLVYDIQINTDKIYQPITDFTASTTHSMNGEVRKAAQQDFAAKFKHLL